MVIRTMRQTVMQKSAQVVYGPLEKHCPSGSILRTSGEILFRHCQDKLESATVTTLDEKIIPYITDICKRDPRTGNVVTGGIVSCQDSSWLLSWTINRQGQFKDQDKDKVCVWVYGLFTDVPGDYIKKPMKDCTGKEITAEWLYHLGVPEDQIMDLAENSAICVPTMMPYITAFFMPRTKGDRRMLSQMDVSTSLSSDSLPKLQEILFSQQSILYVLLWKLFMDFSK